MLPFKTKFGWGIGTLTVSLMFQANGLLLLVWVILPPRAGETDAASRIRDFLKRVFSSNPSK